MMEAEKWYEYQDSYKKYGIDMKPRYEQIERPKTKSGLSSKDRSRLLMLTVIVGVLCVGIIISTAYAAQLKYQINSIIEENQVIEGEIQNLKVDIQTASSITSIEDKAMTELGMVYPENGQIVYLAGEQENSRDFATIIKNQAYN